MAFGAHSVLVEAGITQTLANLCEAPTEMKLYPWSQACTAGT